VIADVVDDAVDALFVLEARGAADAHRRRLLTGRL
jgi:hypothetical protein